MDQVDRICEATLRALETHQLRTDFYPYDVRAWRLRVRADRAYRNELRTHSQIIPELRDLIARINNH